MIDATFSYTNVTRQLLINKFLILRSRHAIPQIKKLFYFFILTKIEDVDDVQIYNYVYLFNYFFGRRAFLTKIKSFFNVGKWSYSLQVGIYIMSKDIYQDFFFYINDIFFSAGFSYVRAGIFSKPLNIYYLVLNDLNIFSEKKTNLGLFFLNKPLNLHVFCCGLDASYLKYFLNNLKMPLSKYEI